MKKYFSIVCITVTILALFLGGCPVDSEDATLKAPFDGADSSWAGTLWSDHLDPESTIAFGDETVTLKGIYWSFLSGKTNLTVLSDYIDALAFETSLPYTVADGKAYIWTNKEKGIGLEIFFLNDTLKVYRYQHAPFEEERTLYQEELPHEFFSISK
jgi:hypothetical protein